MNSDGWIDVDEYTEILRWFGKEGSDIDAAIQFLFGIYDVNGMLRIRCSIYCGKYNIKNINSHFLCQVQIQE